MKVVTTISFVAGIPHIPYQENRNDMMLSFLRAFGGHLKTDSGAQVPLHLSKISRRESGFYHEGFNVEFQQDGELHVVSVYQADILVREIIVHKDFTEYDEHYPNVVQARVCADAIYVPSKFLWAVENSLTRHFLNAKTLEDLPQIGREEDGFRIRLPPKATLFLQVNSTTRSNILVSEMVAAYQRFGVPYMVTDEGAVML